MTKTYVIDTNILLADSGALLAFDDNELVIPMIVLEELDKHKGRQDDVGSNARKVNRRLDELRTAGQGGLHKGITLSNGGRLRVVSLEPESMTHMPIELQAVKNDNVIIATALQLRHAGAVNPILVSKDINVRIKCDALGIASEDYRRMRASPDGEFYTGVEVINVKPRFVAKLYDGILNTNELKLQTSHPNQIVVLKCGDETVLTRIIAKDGSKCLRPIGDHSEVFGLRPRNKEQRFSIDLLCDPDVKMVTLSGPAGTGKSLLAIACALNQLKSLGASPQYDRLIVMRPVQPVGRDIGFLPGTLQEKMEPWIAPIRDNMNFLFSGTKNPEARRLKKRGNTSEVSDEPYLSLLQEAGKIEIEAITFIRGRSIPNSIILVDECQNLSMHELKTILTRASEGTKIILTGDIGQIDNPHLDVQTNAMTYAIERFKESPLTGHVTLLKGERGALANLAASLL